MEGYVLSGTESLLIDVWLGFAPLHVPSAMVQRFSHGV